MNVGFIGIGNMGEPMAANLLRSGQPLVVWNRSPEKCKPLADLGAEIADSPTELFARCSIVLLMLLDSTAIDDVLDRGTPNFPARVSGTTIVLLGTTSPEYSQALESEVLAAGGRYVEAPVSGSRLPAEQGQLVGMVSGQDDSVECVLPLLDPMFTSVFRCGPVPGALRMKLAANHYLIGTVTVLAEMIHAARNAGLNLYVLQQVLNAGPMASAVSRTKLDNLIHRDYVPQAAIRDVSTIADLVLAECVRTGQDTPLIRRCAALYQAALAAGHGDEDMAGIVHAFGNASRRHRPRSKQATHE